MKEPYKNVESIFLDALNLPPEERRAFLDRKCGKDTEFRAYIEKLLSSHGNHDAKVEGLLMADMEGAIPILADERSGENVGRYLLKEKIGEGSVGVVYLADQLEPVQRQVAVKVIKLGMDTLEVIERFEAERQALALMDHPNIAKVFDAGSTEQGRPFFVMELVSGIPLSTYCDQHKLDLDRRLALFADVCQAVQHAHQKGIVHRDLKPANILIASNGDLPVPKIIDFGIAKAIEGRLGDRSMKTSYHSFVGTPLYTSPEQARRGSADVDTRSDIYSLGVILYELLAGRLPFDADDLEERDSDRSQGDPSTFEIRSPTKALKTMEQEKRMSVAANRATTMRRHLSKLEGELEWIVLRCLEEKRFRRYQTANALALDLERYLRGDPVTACPPTKGYLLQKFIKRHKVGFLAGTAVAASLLIGFWIAILALQQEREARVQADEEATQSALVTRFMVEMLDGVGPQVAMGTDPALLREVLDQTQSRLEGHPKPPPEVEAELRETIGKLNFDIGRYEESVAMHRKSLELRRSIFGNESLEVAQSLNHLGRSLPKMFRFEESEQHLREALAIRRKILGSEHLDVADSCDDLSDTLFPHHHHGPWSWRYEKVDEAAALRRESSGIIRTLLGTDNLRYARSLVRLAWVAQFSTPDQPAKNFEESEVILREALSVFRTQLGNDHPEVATTLLHLARTIRSPEERLSIIDEGLAILENFPPISDMHFAADLSSIVHSAGELFSDGPNVRILTHILAYQRKLFGEKHPDIAMTLFYLGRRHFGRRVNLDAEKPLKASLEMTEQLFGENHLFTIQILQWLVYNANKLGKFDEAYAFSQKWLEGQRLLNEDGHLYVSRPNLFPPTMLRDRQDWSESAMREMLALRIEHLGDGHEAVGKAWSRFGGWMRGQGRLEEAKQYHQRAADIYKGQLNDDLVASELIKVGQLSLLMGHFSEAESVLREAIDLNIDLNSRPLGYEYLAKALIAQGKLSEVRLLLENELENSEIQDSPNPNNTWVYQQELISWHLEQGDPIRADQYLQGALDIARQLFETPTQTYVRHNLKLVAYLVRSGQLEEAEAFARECLAALKSHRPNSGTIYQIQILLGRALLDQQKFAEAEKTLLALYEAFSKLPTTQRKNSQWATMDLIVRLYTEWGRPEQVEAFIQENLPALQSLFPYNWQIYSIQTSMGQALLDQQKFAEAEKFLLDFYEDIPKVEPQFRNSVQKDTISLLARLYTEWGRPEEAQIWLEKAE